MSVPRSPHFRPVAGTERESLDQVTTTTVRLVGVTGHLEQVHAEQVTDRRGGIVVLGPDGRNMPEARDRLYAGITFPVKSSCSESMPVGVRLQRKAWYANA